jgi:putative flavoprotein involved in K+ transport
MMTTSMQPVAVIGAGQAGLAMSRCLSDRRIGHVVFERGRVGERWRSERWDSFTLLSPNRQTRLPGHHYRGPEPDGFMTGSQVAAFLEDYGRDAPVCTGITVLGVHPDDGGWLVRTDRGDLPARQVVVATGDLDRPFVPALGDALPADIMQLHSSTYRNPQRLPSGAVLVVGAGPSGQQIADELARAGRTVHVAVGRHKALPRRYRGRDAYWWMEELGMLRRTVDSLPDRTGGRRTPNAVLAGGLEDLDLHRLRRHGAVLHGRLVDVHGTRLRFAGDLAETAEAAEANARRFRARVDEHVRRSGLTVPDGTVPVRARWTASGAGELDIDDAGISTVVWATGYRRDLSWVHAPVFDPAGGLLHRRGVTTAAGLYFLGLRWMHTRSSSFLSGVGADAEHLAGHIAVREQPAYFVA